MRVSDAFEIIDENDDDHNLITEFSFDESGLVGDFTSIPKKPTDD